MRNGAASLLLCACAGSYATASDYGEARATAECGRIQRCDLGFYDSEYSSQEDCVDERGDEIEEQNDQLDEADCRFSSEQAGACVSRIRGMSCEDWAENDASQACDLVWDCTQELS